MAEFDLGAASSNQPSDDTPTSERGKQAKVPLAKPEPKTQLELWSLAYARPDRQLSLKKETVEAIEPEDGELEAVRQLIDTRHQNDPAVWVPARILVALGEGKARREVWQRAAELSVYALSRYAGVGELVDWPMPATSVAQSGEMVFVRAEQHARLRKLNDDRAKVAAQNVVRAYALLQVFARNWDATKLALEMAGRVWRPTQSQQQSHFAQAAALIGVSVGEPLGILVQVFGEEVRTQRRELARAQAEAHRRADEAQKLGRSLETAEWRAQQAEDRATEHEARITELERQLDGERQRGSIDRSHLADDFETLRGEVLRRLSSQVDLLTDGLHALKAGHSPIAEEYVDRALRAITGEVARLREVGKGEQ
ncbi:hypothetical protein ACFFGH_28370 [Lysobacter korlensis]|uniref:KfrA N-terminal DNA-binding domain-containing protein n=1 Tax=Lysobacter korlensis TaxID=553636 RepID=A0ABV6RXQ3_9GAMM